MPSLLLSMALGSQRPSLAAPTGYAFLVTAAGEYLVTDAGEYLIALL